MPRTARASVGGVCYHVLNRGNGGSEVFRKPQDYQAFVKLMELVLKRSPMRVLGFCLMPTHFHFVLWPFADGDLGRWMQWLMTAHVRRYHSHYGSSGHIWQGRFKAFLIQEDLHLLTVLRYVERNPLRAGLVARPENWQWSSLHRRQAGPCELLHESPVPLPPDWVGLTNELQTSAELDGIRHCVVRGAPYGSDNWVRRQVKRCALESTMRPLGRPRRA